MVSVNNTLTRQTSMVITVLVKKTAVLEPLLVEKKHVDVTRTIPSLGLFFCVNEEGHVQRLVILCYITSRSHNKQRVSCQCGDSLQSKLRCLL